MPSLCRAKRPFTLHQSFQEKRCGPQDAASFLLHCVKGGVRTIRAAPPKRGASFLVPYGAICYYKRNAHGRYARTLIFNSSSPGGTAAPVDPQAASRRRRTLIRPLSRKVSDAAGFPGPPHTKRNESSRRPRDAAPEPAKPRTRSAFPPRPLSASYAAKEPAPPGTFFIAPGRFFVRRENGGKSPARART